MFPNRKPLRSAFRQETARPNDCDSGYPYYFQAKAFDLSKMSQIKFSVHFGDIV
jgi:hypothetical protein